MNQPHTTVILAMTADGKIADSKKSPARFGSARDKAHLEEQISQVDAVLLGAGTLRSYGTTLPISNPQLLEIRKQQNKPLQPIQIICSASAKIDSSLRFFSQPVPRWLLTTTTGAKIWQETQQIGFERILIAETAENGIDWIKAWQQFSDLGLQKLAILGGGELVASLLAVDLIDEFCLTVCPLILGGVAAPTAVEGVGLLENQAHRLELLSVERVDQEIFLRYRLLH